MRYRNRSRQKPTRVRGLRVPRVEPLEDRLLLAADIFEPNDSFVEAADLGTGDQAFDDLTIFPAGDQDYYKWTASQDGILRVDILFSTVIADIDLALYDENHFQVEISDSLSDNEHVQHEVFAGQTFFIRAFGFGGDINTYDMLIDGPESTIAQDGFEPNQTFGDASVLGIGDQVHGGLTLHSVFDEDWYQWTASRDGILNVSTLFSNALGNVDLELYASDKTLIDSSTSTSDNEQVITTVAAGEKYFVHVFTPGFENQPDYTLIIDGPEEGVPIDQFEPNDTFQEAAALGSGDQSHLALTIHEPNNDDWYTWLTPADGTVAISTFFSHAVANLDLEVYDANQNLLAASNSTENAEKVVLDRTAGDLLYILVYQPGKGQVQSYNMVIDGPEVVADELEPNDSFATPTDLGTSDISIDELSIHQGISFTSTVTETVKGSSAIPATNEKQSIVIEPAGAATGGSFRLSINTTQTGNVQTGLIPYDADGKMVEAALDTAYGADAFSVAGFTNGPYTVEFVGALGHQDINGLFVTDVSTLTRSGESNDDYFKWIASESGMLNVQVLFQHVLGNVDLQVLDSSQNIIASSTSLTDNEQVSVNVFAGQKYVLRVFGANGSLQSNYQLVVDGPGIAADRFEPNDTSSTAAQLGEGDQLHTGLTIHEPFNDDWFRFTPAMSGTLDVRITFDSALGDLGLELYSSSGDLLDESVTPVNEKDVSADVTGGQDYVIHVTAPIGGFAQPAYDLLINGPGPNRDAYEPNDSFTAAADLGAGDQTLDALTIHVADNEDWYQWTATGAGTVTVDATFAHILGNLDLELYDADENLLDASTSTTDDEQVSAEVDAGQVVYILAYGAGGALLDNYSLQITGNDPPVFSDIANQNIDEDQVDATIQFTIGDDTTPVTELAVSAVSSNPDLLPSESIQLSGTDAERTITLTPAANQSGTTTITLTSSDAEGAEGTVSFVLTVEAVADAPTLTVAGQAAGQEDTLIPLDISAALVDTDGSETLSVEITDLPSGAALSAGTPFASGSWRLTPDDLAGLTITPPEHSDVGFAMTVSAVSTESSNDDTAVTTDTIEVTIDAVADAPNLKVLDAEGEEDTAIALSISSSLIDADGSETLSVVIGVPDGAVLSAGTDNGDGTWTVLDTDLTGLTITTAANTEGDFTLEVTATATETSNGDSAQSTAALLVTVLPVNDAPTISDILDQAGDEDVVVGPVAFTVADAETAADQLTVTATSDNATLLPEANIVLAGDGSDRTVTITPAENLSGSATITVTVTDQQGSQASDTFSLVVSPVNDIPTISDISDQVTPEETPTDPIALTVADVETEAEALTVTATSDDQALVPDANIVIEGTGSDRTVTITPASNQAGRATITVLAADPDGGVGSQTFMLEVGNVNDQPTMSDISDQTVLEDTPTDALPLTVNDFETPADALVVTASSDNPDLVPDENIVIGGTGSDRTVTVTPAQDQSGSALITVTVADGDGGVVSDTFMLDVTPVNDPPVITSSDSVSVPENTTAVSTITATDVEGDTLTYSISGGADVALFAVNSITGGLSFTTAQDFEDPADANGDNVYEIEVAAEDGNGGVTNQLIQVSVTDQIEDAVPPTVQVLDVSPNLRAGPVGEVTILFTEAVSGFDLSDLTLTRKTDDAVDISLAAATLTTTDQATWTLSGMTELTGGSGIYELTLLAAGSGITDLAGNPLANGDQDSWINGAGDANGDNEFNQIDLIQLLQNGKYLSDQPATWSEGDFDGNGRFDQFDIIVIQSTTPRHYLQGPFGATAAPADVPSAAAGAVDMALAEADAGQAGETDLSAGQSDLIAHLIDAALADDEDE